jgi:hypothetical protein
MNRTAPCGHFYREHRGNAPVTPEGTVAARVSARPKIWTVVAGRQIESFSVEGGNSKLIAAYRANRIV